MLSRRLSRPRATAVVAIAATLAAVVAVSPSFATQKAGHVLLTSKKAAGLYLRKKSANTLYLKKKAAGNLFVAKADAPLTPVVGIAAGSAPFSASATTAGYIPSAFTSFATPGIAPAVITFSGNATCTAEKPSVELACPIQILVDGQSMGKVNFAPSTAFSAKALPIAYTVTQTTVLTKGGHTVAVQYAGAAKVTFALKSWSLAVQAYPQAPEPPAPEEAGGKGGK